MYSEEALYSWYMKEHENNRVNWFYLLVLLTAVFMIYMIGRNSGYNSCLNLSEHDYSIAQLKHLIYGTE